MTDTCPRRIAIEKGEPAPRFDFPAGTLLIEIRGIYDGWSVAQLPDGTLVNRWTPDDYRRAQTQEWIERREGERG